MMMMRMMMMMMMLFMMMMMMMVMMIMMDGDEVLGSVHFLNNVVKLGKLLSFFISLSEADTNFLGGVHAKSVHNIPEEEQVKLTLAIPVIDVTDLLHSVGVNHLVCCENTLVIT